MNETERAALEKELIWALMPYPDTEFQARLAVMPIIDRLLAERDIDAMLDSVHPRATCTVRWVWNGPERVGCIARIGTPISGHVGERVHEATGPTRMAAIRAAVAKAKEVQHGTR